MLPILRPAYERDLAAARRAMGADRFADPWALGSVMTVDQLVEYARQMNVAASQSPASSADPPSWVYQPGCKPRSGPSSTRSQPHHANSFGRLNNPSTVPVLCYANTSVVL